MKINFLPQTHLGKWSAGLTIFFLVIISTSVVLVMVLNVLNFDDRWWDVTVPTAFVISMSAFSTRKCRGKRLLYYKT